MKSINYNQDWATQIVLQYREVWNRKLQVEDYSKLFKSSFVFHYHNFTINGIAEYIDFIAHAKQVTSGLYLVPEVIFAHENRILLYFRWSADKWHEDIVKGNQLSNFCKIVFRIEQGKIVEKWEQAPDFLYLLGKDIPRGIMEYPEVIQGNLFIREKEGLYQTKDSETDFMSSLFKKMNDCFFGNSPLRHMKHLQNADMIFYNGDQKGTGIEEWKTFAYAIHTALGKKKPIRYEDIYIREKNQLTIFLRAGVDDDTPDDDSPYILAGLNGMVASLKFKVNNNKIQLLYTHIENYLSFLDTDFSEHPTKIKNLFYGKRVPLIQPKINYSPLIDKIEALENKSSNKEQVAIVGIAGKFPQCNSVDEYWKTLVEKKNVFSEIPEDRSVIKNGTKIRYAGFMNDVDLFDAQFFHIPPIASEYMDPQQRLLMEVVIHCIEDSGHKTSDFSGPATGIFISTLSDDYKKLLQDHDAPFNAFYWMGNEVAMFPSKIASFLNIQGHCKYINAECASSLIAIHEASNLIRNGDIDQAIIGATSLFLHSYGFTVREETLLSAEPAPRLFSKQSQGQLRGEAIVSVMLKSLTKAIEDKDNIYGLVAGSAINNSGKTFSIAAANVKQQAAVILDAWDNASVDPSDISLIECHASGIREGDFAEIASIKKAFNQRKNKERDSSRCNLTSGKGCIGHTEAASGLTSLIKLLLQFRHQQIIGIQGLTEIDSSLSIDQSNLQLIKDHIPWKRIVKRGKEQAKVAGINAFAAGGYNAHIVIKEYLTKEEPLNNQLLEDRIHVTQHSRKRPLLSQHHPSIIVLSAATEESLRLLLRNFRKFLNAKSDIDLINLAYTLQIGREAMKFRIAFVVSSIAELILQMESLAENKKHPKNVFMGQKNEKFSVNISDTEEGHRYISELLSHKKQLKIAELWSHGSSIPWEIIEQKEKACRLSGLPNYCFNKERYWVPEINTNVRGSTKNSKSVNFIHPLLHENTSDLSEQRFTSTFTGEEFFLNDHQVNGQKILPAVAYLEMTRAAVTQATPTQQESTILEFHNIVWAQSVVAVHKEVAIALFANDDKQIDYEIYSTEVGQEIVHCQGKVQFSNKPMPAKLDLEQLQGQMQQDSLDVASLYRTFTKIGIHYGASYQGITAIYQGDQQLLAQLSLFAIVEHNQNDYILHPSLMDSALQASMCIITDPNQHLKQPLLPFALESLSIVSGCTKDMIAWVRYSPASKAEDKVNKLDIDLIDSQGNICVQMRCLSYRIGNVVTEPTIQPKWQFSTANGGINHANSMNTAEKIELFLKQEIALQLQKNIQNIATDQNYFELGITSLGFTSIIHNTNHLLQENLSPSLVFEYTDIQQFTTYLATTYPTKIDALLVTKQKNDSNTKQQLDHWQKLTPLPRKKRFWGSPTQLLSDQATITESKEQTNTKRPSTQLAVKERSLKLNEFPLSVGQKGLYILQKINPETSAYNVPLCFKINSKVNVDLLEKAWDYVLQQFSILTAKVIEKQGALYHCLDDKCKTTIQQQAIYFKDDQQQLLFLQKQVKAPFDLNQGPLTRINLFTRDKQDFILLLTIHHIIFDGTSAVILLKSLFTHYLQLCQGKQAVVSQELFGYQEFVTWEKTMLASAEGQSHAGYWQQQLSGELPTFELFPNLPCLASPGYQGKTLIEDLPEELSIWANAFSQSQSLQPSVIFLAIFQLLLHKYTNQEDIIVGMPVMGRVSQKFADKIGYFINMVPLRTNCSEKLKLSEFLRNVQATMLDALFHSSYPFPLMLDKLKCTQGEKNPIFQVSYAYQNYIQQADITLFAQQHALGIETVAGIYQEGDFDLGLEIFENKTSFSIHFKYNSDLYSQDTIKRLFEHYCVLLKAVSKDQNLEVHEYPIITAQEKHQLLVDYNDTQSDYPKDKCIHQLFAEQVEIKPNKTAIIYEDEQLSYQQLFDKSHDLALYLQSLGVKPDNLVGLCVERSLEMMVGIMGILQAGAAYMPLDPDYPEDRLAYMLTDSQAAIVLTQDKLHDKLTTLIAKDTKLVTLDKQWPEIASSVADYNNKKVKLHQEVKPDHLAYMIYTSGSTGKPKGVMVEHCALLNRIYWMQQQYPLNKDDIVLQKTPFSFDVSVWEFVWPLMSGALIVFAIPGGHKNVHYLEMLISEKKVTTLHFVPSMLNTYLKNAKTTCKSIKRIFCSGESLGSESVNDYQTKFPQAQLYNLYGPTEATIDATAYNCSQLDYPFVPIGTPIANTQIYILDEINNIHPIGVPGELHIAGDGLARGYLNHTELTEDKFIANPFKPGTRMYKSGDLARWLADGNIEYLGRIDTQVKIRGFRIELGEIEARLNQYPQIKDSVVVAQGQEANKQLIAFYLATATLEDNIINLSSEDLRAHLQKILPEHMLPAAFVSLEIIPLTTNGKVDRRALERMDVSLESSQAYLAPRNDTEKQLVAIWAEVLNLEPEKIGVNDRFFELGGDSIKIIQIVSKAAEHNIHFDIRDMFTYHNIQSLLEHCDTINSIEIIKEEGVLQGTVGLSPIQSYFFEHIQTDIHHYNQSVLLNLNINLFTKNLQEIATLLIKQHDALRLRYFKDNNGWQQRFLDSAVHTPEIHSYDISDLDKKQLSSYIKDTCNHWQASLDIEKGPILRWVYFESKGNGCDQLAIIIHHLVIDGVSWRILLGDLTTLIAQLSTQQNQQKAIYQGLQLSQKRSSYRNWVNSLAAYNASKQGQKDLDFWLEQNKKAKNLTDAFTAKGYRYRDILHTNIKLSKSNTEKLLTRCHQAYGTEINDLLLTAVVLGYYRNTGNKNLMINMEGHGRERIDPAIDITKTLGWFTSIYPVLCALSNPEDIGQSIKEIKESLHEIPNKGVGFLIFRYIDQHEEIKKIPTPQVVFNYLGDFQSYTGETSGPHFSFSQNSSGTLYSQRTEINELVSINGWVVSGQLSFTFSYPEEWRDKKISDWKTHFISALETLIEHCQNYDKINAGKNLFNLSTQAVEKDYVLLQKGDKENGILCFPGIPGFSAYYHTLVTKLGINSQIYGINTYRATKHRPIFTSMKNLVQYTRGQLENKCTPNYLFGHSFGAIVALETALKLENNKPITSLLIFDQEPYSYNEKIFEGEISKSVFLSLLRNIGQLLNVQAITTKAEMFVSTISKIHSMKKLIDCLRKALMLNNVDISIKETESFFDLIRCNYEIMNDKVNTNQINQIVLFKAKEGESQNNIDESKWQKYSKKAIKTIRVPGNHFSIFHEPHVNELAKAILNILE